MSSAVVKEVDSDEEDDNVPPLEEKAGGAEEKVDTEDTTLADSDVVTKYQEAARIVQAALIEITSLVSIRSSIVIY